MADASENALNAESEVDSGEFEAQTSTEHETRTDADESNNESVTSVHRENESSTDEDYSLARPNEDQDNHIPEEQAQQDQESATRESVAQEVVTQETVSQESVTTDTSLTESERDEQTSSEHKNVKPTKHAMIMRGIVTPILVMLALTCLVLGIFNSTLWKPSREVPAVTQGLTVPYVVTDPGVLDLVDEHVTVEVHTQASTAKICVATANATDAQGWLNQESYARIEGLKNWSSLKTSMISSSASLTSNSQGVPFETSDLWQHVQCGNSTVTLKVAVHDPRTVALISTTVPAAAMQITLQWMRASVPNFAIPLYFMAILLLICAVLAASVFAIEPRKRRKRSVASKPADDRDEVTISEAFAGSFNNLKSGLRPRKPSRHGVSKHGYKSTSEKDAISTSQELSVSQHGIQNVNDEDTVPASEQTAIEEEQLDTKHALYEQNNSCEQTSDELDQASINDSDFAETTTVISDEEFAAYFARLATEDADNQQEESQQVDDSDQAAKE